MHSHILDLPMCFRSRLTNSNDPIARGLDDRLRNSSFPNIGTTCMQDAPPASTDNAYTCGDGDRNFDVPPDSTNYNQFARCSECFSKTLQVRMDGLCLNCFAFDVD